MTSSSRPRLTVALLARDAEQPLHETLTSVVSVADEIVVADTGSQDRTRDVATRHGAIVVDVAWSDDFSAARNELWAHLHGDWILWLDAGEQMSVDDATRLRAFLETDADRDRAYMMLVCVPPGGRNLDGEQIAQIRLVANRPELRFAGRVRESLAPALAALGMEAHGLPYRIQRGQREHDTRVKQQRARRNVKLADLEIQQHGPRALWLNVLGEAFQALGDERRAIELFRHALAESTKGSLEMLEAYYGLLTSLNEDAELHEAQLAICLQALEQFPLDTQLLCAMGGYLQSKGELELAARSYQTAFEHGSVNPQLWHLTRLNEVAASCCSLTLQLRQRNDEAQQVLERALAEMPQSQRLRRQLLELHVRSGRTKEALAQLQSLADCVPHIEGLRSAVRGACMAAQQNWIAARAYLEAAHKAGCRDLLCLRWLTLTLAALARGDEARPVLEQWLALEPTSREANELAESLIHAGGAPKSICSEGGQTPNPPSDRHLRLDAASTPKKNSPNTSSAPSRAPKRL